jgi:hypothetical protein
MMCKWHSEHKDTCNVCLEWEKALKEWRDSVIPPPQHHPMVTLIKAEAWIGQVFNTDSQENET